MRDIDNYTGKYLEKDFEEYQVLYRRKKVCEVISKYNPKSILEVGCGMKPLFTDYENIEFTVVEPSEVFASNALKMAQGRKNIRLIKTFFDKNFVIDRQYDMIICSALLHEVESPADMLDGLYRVASNDTIIHINVPNAKSFHRLLAKESGIIKDLHELSGRNVLLQQHSVFDMNALNELVTGHGFEIIEAGSFFVKPFSHKQMMRLMDEGIVDSNLLDGLYEMTKYMPEMGSEIFVNCKKTEKEKG